MLFSRQAGLFAICVEIPRICPRAPVFDPTIGERGAAFLEKPFSGGGAGRQGRDVLGH